MTKSYSLFSLNCFGVPYSFNRKRRFNLIAKAILERQPDLVLLQEVTSPRDRGILYSVLEPAGYDCYPKNSIYFSEGGLFMATRLPVMSYNFEHYAHKGPFLPISWLGRILKKGFQTAQLKAANGDRVTVINTHLLANYHGLKTETMSQMKQLDQLMGTIKKYEKGAMIVAGDFNFTPKSSLYHCLMMNTRLLDPFDGGSNSTLSPAYYRQWWLYQSIWDELKRLDYIFLNSLKCAGKKEILFSKPVRTARGYTYLSDHNAVTADFVL